MYRIPSRCHSASLVDDVGITRFMDTDFMYSNMALPAPLPIATAMVAASSACSFSVRVMPSCGLPDSLQSSLLLLLHSLQLTQECFLVFLTAVQ